MKIWHIAWLGQGSVKIFSGPEGSKVKGDWEALEWMV